MYSTIATTAAARPMAILAEVNRERVSMEVVCILANKRKQSDTASQ
jgi:hypothetical protein